MFRWGSKAIARWKVPQFKRALVSAVRPVRAPQAGKGTTQGVRQAPPSGPRPVAVAGTQGNWLRVLGAADLLAYLNAESALNAIWHQSHLAEVVWQRDLLAAIRRYAEFVQLMPASESHHHAHAGGLLAHTLEMTLAAATWRNGHLLPPGAAIEQMDAEHDAWTYVVFFAALLHDIAKPMTDLRIHWKAGEMTEALRWTPVAGSLMQITHGRANPEYLVEFTPKNLRDYTAHSRLAITLLPQIAPPPALTLLARTPAAMEALERFLSGRDKESVIAQIVARADRASTERALLAGSRARFATATSVPLVELLMGAIRVMLQSGTELPLNRSGAAGWVHDGAVWFVAKRLADAVRAWIQAHEPGEGVPGENKNDRLFDTWQEYGCIETNPVTGHAVWYVTVEGAGAEPGAAYTHQLTMLKFPLGKLFEDAAGYPPAMAGHIVVRQKPAAKDRADATAETQEAASADGQAVPEAASGKAQPPQGTGAKPTAAAPEAAEGLVRVALRAPTFNRPKPAKPKGAPPVAQEARASGQVSKPARSQAAERAVPQSVNTDDGLLGDEEDAPMRPAAQPPRMGAAPISMSGVTVTGGMARSDADDGFLGAADDARSATRPASKPHESKGAAAAEVLRADRDEQAAESAIRANPPGPAVRRMFARSDALSLPVVLQPVLPQLPRANVDACRAAEPSATALAFIAWLQRGLASREIKYNETGAPVHFTAEGMALVSPLIFKLFAQHDAPDADPEEAGMRIQREVIRAGWHRVVRRKEKGRVNILRYEVVGRSRKPAAHISALVLAEPDRWVLPVPPENPVLKLLDEA